MATNDTLQNANGGIDRKERENGVENGGKRDIGDDRSRQDENGQDGNSKGTAVPGNWSSTKQETPAQQTPPKPSMMRKFVDKLGLDVGTVLMMFK